MSVLDGVSNLKVESDPARLALETAEHTLKSTPDDLAAANQKLDALVALDKFGAAAKFGASLKHPELTVSYAYALYRTGNVEALRKLAKPSLSWAQAEYKAGHFSAASKLFSEIVVSDEQDVTDISTNKQAIAALRGDASAVTSLNSSTPFDRHFNLAYAYLVAGRPKEALEELSTAKLEANDEDDQLATVVQAAYAHQLLGHIEEAADLLKSIDSNSGSSSALATIVANNLLSIIPPDTPESIHRALKVYDSLVTGSSDFNADQKAILNANRLALLFKAKNISKKSVARYLAEYPYSVTPAVLAAQASSKGNERKLAKDASIGSTLARAQIAADAGDLETAARILLKNLDTSRPLPSSLAAAAIAASEYLDSDTRSIVPQLSSEASIFDLTAAAVLAESSDRSASQATRAYFEKLADPVLRAAGKCLLEPSEVSDSELASLPSIAELTAHVNLAEAEQGVIAKRAAAHVKPDQSKKRKRSGKPKLPKDYDPERQPNPERWLAKQDRSDYKAPKKARKSQASQGAVVTDSTPEPSTVLQAKTKPKAKKKKGKK